MKINQVPARKSCKNKLIAAFKRFLLCFVKDFIYGYNDDNEDDEYAAFSIFA